MPERDALARLEEWARKGLDPHHVSNSRWVSNIRIYADYSFIRLRSSGRSINGTGSTPAAAIHAALDKAEGK